MLLLSRRVNQSLVINSNITIKILEQKGKQILFGITAPKEISVHREEIYKKVVKKSQTLKS